MGRGVARKDPTHVSPKVKLSIHTTYQVCRSKGLFGQVPLLASFGPDMKTEMSVVISMHLKHSPDYIDSTYIWVQGSNSQGSSVMAEIPFLTFLALYREIRRCGQVGPS